MGKIQNEDIKSSAELIAAGGTAAQLPNDSKIYISANNINDTLYNAVSKGLIGGGGGGKNYLTAYTASTSSGVANTGNGDFEQGSTVGWSLAHSALSAIKVPTAVASAGTPFSSTSGGSAASGTLSLSVVSSGQISKTYSGSLASSGISTAGNMLISSAFYIDASDQGSVLAFRFAYKVQSGKANLNFSGSSSNSFAVYIYDVTAGSWQQPAGVYTMVQNDGVGIATGEFQTLSTSTQFQIAIVNINASAGAYTLYIDEFSVGPNKAFGVIPKAPTVTKYTSGSGTYTVPSGVQFLRVRMVGGGGGGGASGTASWGAAQGGTASTFGTSFLTANGGSAGTYNSTNAGGGGTIVSPAVGTVYTGGAGATPNYIASSPITAAGGTGGSSFLGGGAGGGYSGNVGLSAANYGGYGGGGGGGGIYSVASGYGGGGGSGAGGVDAVIANPAATYSYTVGTGGNGGTAGTSGYAGGRGADGYIEITEYYVGSNVQMSNDSDTRVVTGSFVTGTSFTATSSITYPTAGWNAQFDSHGSFSSGAGSYSVPCAGYYEITAFAAMSTVAGNTLLAFKVNNGGSSFLGTGIGSTSGSDRLGGAYPLGFLSAGSTVQVGLYSASNSTCNLLQWGIKRLSGPAQIAASESVNAHFTNTNANTIANSGNTTIGNWTKDFDSHAAMSPVSGVYTVPIAGKYRISVMLTSAATAFTSASSAYYGIDVTGTQTVHIAIVPINSTQTYFISPTGSVVLSYKAGDTISINGVNSTGVSVSLNTGGYNHLSIERVGN